MRGYVRHSRQCLELVPKRFRQRRMQELRHQSQAKCVRETQCRAEFGTGDVAVVGGGVMGLTTAVMLKQRFSNLAIDIIAEKDYSESTSHGAAGLWEPYQIVGTPDEDINRWGQSTYEQFDSLGRSAEGALAGVQFVTCHTLSSEDPTEPQDVPAWSRIVHNFTNHSSTPTASENTKTSNGKSDGNGSASNGSAGPSSLLNYGSDLTLTQEFGTYIVDQTYYLPFLAAKVGALGVQQYKTRVQSFNDLQKSGYKCVFNCTGLGSRELANDADLVPVRGQVRRVRAPWVKHAMFLDHTFYILPNLDSIVIGGTAQPGDERTEVDWEDSDRIWKHVLRMCPSLETAETVTDWVGLRPLRTSGVRLERDDLTLATSGVPVVHNYGHGGSGITLHWGCAQEAVAMVSEELNAIQGSADQQAVAASS